MMVLVWKVLVDEEVALCLVWEFVCIVGICGFWVWFLIVCMVLVDVG